MFAQADFDLFSWTRVCWYLLQLQAHRVQRLVVACCMRRCQEPRHDSLDRRPDQVRLLEGFAVDERTDLLYAGGGDRRTLSRPCFCIFRSIGKDVFFVVRAFNGISAFVRRLSRSIDLKYSLSSWAPGSSSSTLFLGGAKVSLCGCGGPSAIVILGAGRVTVGLCALCLACRRAYLRKIILDLGTLQPRCAWVLALSNQVKSHYEGSKLSSDILPTWVSIILASCCPSDI